MKTIQTRAILSPTLLLTMKTQRALSDAATWISDFLTEMRKVRKEAYKRLR